jgi:hypothetical protein
MARVFNHPLAPLLLFSVILAAVFVAYLAVGGAPDVQMIASFGWTLLLAMWVVADMRRRQGVPCFDFGFFCYVFLPLIVPAYCFWSRGWRGALMLGALVGLWIAPNVIAVFVWWILYR